MKTKTSRSPLIVAIRHDGHVEVWTGLSAAETEEALAAYHVGDMDNDKGLHDYHNHLVIRDLAELDAAIVDPHAHHPHAWVELTSALEEQRWRFEITK